MKPWKKLKTSEEDPNCVIMDIATQSKKQQKISISQSNVMYMEIFVKDFSGTAFPRILKFGKNIRYDELYCV